MQEFHLLTAGVRAVLPSELFLQAWRPPAFLLAGTVSWLSLFIVGVTFGYIVVSYLLCIVFILFY